MTPGPKWDGGSAPPPAVEDFEIALRLLDRQLVGSQDQLLGNVDNAVLEPVDGRLAVTALLSGPAGLAPRFGGRTQTWMIAIWRRLRPEPDPAPIVIPMAHVVALGSDIALDDAGQQLVAEGARLERWLRDNLIERIPGATGGPDRLAGQPLPASPDDRRNTPSADVGSHHLVSGLIGCPVRDPAGTHLGVVLEVTADSPHPGRHHIGPLTIRAVVYGRRRLGARLGYASRPDLGPVIIAVALRRWHRHNRRAEIDDITIDWAEGRVTVHHPERAGRPTQRS